MSTQLQAQEKGTVRAWATHPEARKNITDNLGGWMDGDAFIAQLLTSLSHDNIRPCTEESKFRALQTCAALGMLPSMQHVALIPRKNRDKGIIEVTVMPQWQGLKALMERHPDIEEVDAHLVHVTDRLTYNSTSRQVEDHAYNPFDPARKMDKVEDILGGYLEVRYRDHSRPAKFHFVTAEQIKKARNCAQTQDVWNKWFREMALKTVYRNAYARRVVSIDPLVARQFEKANEIDDAELGNDPARVTSAAVVQQAPAPQLSRTQQLAQQFSPPPEVHGDSLGADVAGGTVIDQPKKPAKKKAAKDEPVEEDASSVMPPPAYPEYFDAYVVDLRTAKNSTQVMAAWNAHVSHNEELLKDDRAIGDKLRDWRLEQLGVAPKGGKLFEDSPRYE